MRLIGYRLVFVIAFLIATAASWAVSLFTPDFGAPLVVFILAFFIACAFGLRRWVFGY